MGRLLSRSAGFKLLLRLVIAVGLVWVVFRRALPSGEEGVWGSLKQAWNPAGGAQAGLPSPWLTFACALLIIGLGFGLNALRFRGLLRAAGSRAGWGGLLRAYLVAGFFNLVLPGAILGDAYRVMDIKSLAGRTSNALGLVVVERLLGLSALGSIGLVCLPFLPGELLAEQGLSWLPLSLGLLLLLGSLAALYPPSNRLLIRACGLCSPISSSMAERASAVLTQVGRMWCYPRVLLQTFGLSLIAQGLLVLSVWVLGQSLAERVEWHWYPLIIPFATLLSLAPVSIGAAGIREYLYVTLFGLAGMGASSALALSLSLFAATLLWGFVGLLLFCLGRTSRAEAQRDA